MTNTKEKLQNINYLISQTDELYHQIALKLNLSDSVMHILYVVYDHQYTCLLSDIYKQVGISKQTINSALRKLEKENFIYLKQETGRSKRLYLTEQGQTLTKQTIARLYDAECQILASWQPSEIDTYIYYLKKYHDALHAQMQNL